MKGIAVLVLFSALTMNACSEFPVYTSTFLPPVIDGGHGIHGWLAELHGMQGLSPELLQAALDTREREFAENPTASNRLRFALLLAAGNESIRDYTRALELLTDINPQLQDPAELTLANTLYQFLEQQKKDNNTITDLGKQIKDQRGRIRELEQQQRALTTIEQNIKQREKDDEEPQ